MAALIFSNVRACVCMQRFQVTSEMMICIEPLVLTYIFIQGTTFGIKHCPFHKTTWHSPIALLRDGGRRVSSTQSQPPHACTINDWNNLWTYKSSHSGCCTGQQFNSQCNVSTTRNYANVVMASPCLACPPCTPPHTPHAVHRASRQNLFKSIFFVTHA